MGRRAGARRRDHAGRHGVRGECRFFRAPGRAEGQHARAVSERTVGWSDAIARLIRSGHRYPDILGYTLGQLNAFLAADSRLEHERLSTQLAVMTTAAQGNREGIRQLQAELQQGMRDEDRSGR